MDLFIIFNLMLWVSALCVIALLILYPVTKVVKNKIVSAAINAAIGVIAYIVVNELIENITEGTMGAEGIKFTEDEIRLVGERRYKSPKYVPIIGYITLIPVGAIAVLAMTNQLPDKFAWYPALLLVPFAISEIVDFLKRRKAGNLFVEQYYNEVEDETDN